MRPISIFILTLFLFSCEEQFGLNDDKISQKIVDSSLLLFEGEVLEKKSTKLDGVDVWKVRIENEFGSIVSFYWQRSYTKLFRIEGEQGPFNYELKPPLSVIVLSTARFLALESHESEELQSWRLIKDSSLNQQWVYQFFLKEKESPVSVNASSGDLL